MNFKKKFFSAFVNFLLISALFIALSQLNIHYTETDFTFTITNKIVLFIILLQIILLLVSAKAWCSLLYNCTHQILPAKGGVEQVGFMLIGKYIPGKIWGIAIRAMTSSRYKVHSDHIIKASLIEQIVSLYIASILGLSIYIWRFNPVLSIALIFTTILLGYHFVRLIFSIILYILPSKIDFLRKYLSILNETSYIKFTYNVCLYSIIWFVLALILLLITLSSNIPSSPNILFVFLGAYMLAVFSGFIAFFAPGGLVVREFVFIFLCPPELNPSIALELAIAFRLWNSMYDIFSASIAYIIYLLHRKTL